MKPLRHICLILIIACSAIIVVGQNPQNDAALRKAAQDGDMKTVNVLAAQGASVNAKDDTGKTALLWVAPARDNPEMVRALIALGADANATDNDGETALMIAASQDNPGIVEALLAAGVEIDAANNAGGTALMAAAFRANIEIVKTLLAKGADLKLKDKKEKTAYDVARAGSGNYRDAINKRRFAETMKLLRIPL
jgi:ankyrin repeat protein